MEEKEIALIDVLNPIWKRKWLIIIPTFFLIIAAGVISSFLSPIWEVEVIIQPGRFFIQTETGRYEEVAVVEPDQIVEQINRDSYNNPIAAELNLDLREFPKLRAENLRNTKLVRIFLREKDVDKAKLILSSLLNYINQELEEADIETKEIDSQIKSKTRTENEIKILQNKLNIIGQRKKEIEKEMRDVWQRIESLEKVRRLSLENKNRSEAENLEMLLYSNEIQESLRYYNTLNELLSDKKITEADLRLEIEEKEGKRETLERIIDRASKKIERKKFSQIIKEPTSSMHPVFPKKKIVVIITGILALLIFTTLALFLEFIEKQKSKG